MINIRRLYRRLYKFIIERIDPVRYAKKIGVNIKGDLHVYGEIHWSTEPWIITIGNNVHLTDNVRFLTHDASTIIFRDKVPDLEITKPITVGDDVFIGNSVIILPGVKIGDRVVIGAGAVVSRDIPDNSVAVGVPARVVKTADEYFEKLKKESLHVGHLTWKEKDDALKKIYNYQGNSKGIYF